MSLLKIERVYFIFILYHAKRDVGREIIVGSRSSLHGDAFAYRSFRKLRPGHPDLS